jgi:hypothetical protein
MMREPAIGSYRDAEGARHELVARETADGGWHVLDLDLESETAHVIETLADGEDGRPQAEAIARDYLTTVGVHEPGAGPPSADPISEQGGSDERSHRHPRQGPRKREPRGAARPRAAR